MEINKIPLIYWANKISLQKSAGQAERLSSLLAQSTIDLNPHQLHATLFAFNSPLSRGAILADEVGLGKTIEAGLVASQLWLEGKRRILIIVPASLRTQWQEELEVHFNLPSTIVDKNYFDAQINSGAPTPLTIEGIFIVSLPFVYRRIGLVESQPWDLVIIDEAHKLRRVYRGEDASKMAFGLRQAIQDKPKLLLTATPLQNDLLELYGLISFIDNKLLGSQYFFKTRFVEPLKQEGVDPNPILKKIRELILGPADGSNFEHPQGVIVRTLRHQVRHYINFPPRKSFTIDFDPNDQEWKLYEVVSAYLQRKDIAAIEHTQRNLMILVYRKLLASSSFAIAPTLKRLADRLKNELILRSSKKDREQNESENNAKYLLEGSEEIEELEEIEGSVKERVLGEFTDNDIINEIKELEEYYKLAISIEENAKGVALVNTLRNIFNEAKKKNWPEKVVIFTESRRTQEYLKRILKENGFRVTIFNGSNNSKDAQKAYNNWKKEFPESAMNLSHSIATRQALIYEFKTDSQVLLTTEAGAEGLNLQFANIVVNYDLPWNPQRVEQRIGRCHRYGQRYETLVVNMLNTRNYADKRLLELLKQKLNLFDGIFGSSDGILGAIESGVDFEKKIFEVYQTCKTPEEIDTAFKKIQKELEGLRKKEIVDIKVRVIDYFDEPILQVFKKTEEEVSAVLNEYDQSMIRLCNLYFVDEMQATKDPGIFDITFQKQKKQYLFREEKEEEKGKIARIHQDHSIIKHILKEVTGLTTKPIPIIEIHYTKSSKKMQSIDNQKGKEGMLYLFKLIVEGVETDEALAPLFFIQDKDVWHTLDLQEGKFLIELPIHNAKKNIEKSPFSKEKLIEEWNKWKIVAVERFEKRNKRLYIREQDRIERFWDSQTLKNQDQIEKLEREIKELKRKKSNTIAFEHLRELAQKIQRAEIRLQRLKVEKIKLETNALEEKEKDFKDLNKKLELNKREELLAVAKFKII